MSQPRILFVTGHWEDDPRSATEIRALQTAWALRDIGHLEVALVQHRSSTEGSNACLGFGTVGTFVVDDAPNRTWRARLAWFLNPHAELRHGIGATPSELRRLELVRNEFDLVWFFKLRTANMFPRWHWPRSVVDIDDVPSTFERSVRQSARAVHRKVTPGLREWSWRRHERLLGQRFDVVTVCSNEDRDYLRGLGMQGPLHVVPNGSAAPTVPPQRTTATPPRLGFIGVFDHHPNAEGVRWFVEECWPLVRQEIPEARLRLAGRGGDGLAWPSGRGIEPLGYVADADAEMATWAAMVVPIRTGAGTRGKIAHAFSQRCPVVSTGLGAYGYTPRDRYDMLLGESAGEFAGACIRAIREPESMAAMADRAWQRFLDRWTWKAIRPAVWSAAEQCLALSKAGMEPRAARSSK